MQPSSPAPTFDTLGLSAAALATIRTAGFTTPTPVQTRAIPPALDGRDVIAIAATGTGKTAAFVLPIVERLTARPASGTKPVRALVLAPTRELVQQIAETVRTFGQARGVKCAHVVGGVGFDQQVVSLRDGREILVATPGRLLDHLQQGTARLGSVEVLVLDEADRMLDMGFLPQIEKVLAHVPEERQTMLFSATMGDEVSRFARRCLADPVRIETVPSGTVAARATQRVFHVPQTSKFPLLLALLGTSPDTTLVFTRTKHRAEKLAKMLNRAGLRAHRIHGDRTQGQRNAALEAFRSGEVKILVATDVAARGLDVEDIAHVVCFDLSLVPDDHVHRVGRTARAAAAGLASSFCSPEELDLLRGIEKFTRSEIPVAPVPDGIPASEVPTPEARSRPPVRPAHPPRVEPFRAPDDGEGRAPRHGPRRFSHDGRPGGHGPRRPSHGERTDRVPPHRARVQDDDGDEAPRPVHDESARTAHPRSPAHARSHGPAHPRTSHGDTRPPRTGGYGAHRTGHGPSHPRARRPHDDRPRDDRPREDRPHHGGRPHHGPSHPHPRHPRRPRNDR